MDRRTFLAEAGTIGLMGSLGAAPFARGADDPSKLTPTKYEVAAYYFGNYHVDPRNEIAHGPGWTEWNLVKSARPRFPGHNQPKVPLWGYQDESDPRVFEQKIQAAADHAISAFIFDWYWYNDGPFLERALEKGFLQASNRDRLKFAIMWANHNWTDIHPAKLGSKPQLQFPGAVTTETFRRLSDHLIERYFKQPNYWLVDGCPYFSIYEPLRFVEGFGSIEKAAEEMASFRKRVKSVGFPDVHFNAIIWGEQLLPSQTRISDIRPFLQKLGVDSIGSYVWIHHTKFRTFPTVTYDDIATQYEQYRVHAAADAGKPYIPNVSVGWDSSPRACQTDTFISREYPFTSVVEGSTPRKFGQYLTSAKKFLDQSGARNKILTINSWNEWTEGSYLEPDTEHRFDYLEQIANIFK